MHAGQGTYWCRCCWRGAYLHGGRKSDGALAMRSRAREGFGVSSMFDCECTCGSLLRKVCSLK